jgi:WD40 repeat protein
MINAGAGFQGTTVSPRFIFGVNGELKDNIFLLEDHRVVYPAGHNVVVYNMEDKSQYFYAGSEGSEGITAITVSPGKKYIAICERSDKAQCYIFDTTTQRRRKCLVANECESKDFISVAFSPSNEKSYLITLSGEPDWMLIFWQWDKIKVLANIKIGINGP